MADDIDRVIEDFGFLVRQVAHLQRYTYALHEYIREQRFYDEVRFAELFAEFDADLTAALEKRAAAEEDGSKSRHAALLKMLKEFQGRPH